MSEITKDAILAKLNWRYAVKRFDANRTISPDQEDFLKEVLRLTPSSFGLQPWHFYFISDADLKKKLRAHCWNQPQPEEASHLIVLCSYRDITPDHVNDYIEFVAKEREVEVESLQKMANGIQGFIANMDAAQKSHWLKLQTYIALGSLMTVSALAGIDTCPMEGFSPIAFDKELGLEDKNLQSVVLCTVGFRSDEDMFAGFKKVRFPANELITDLK